MPLEGGSRLGLYEVLALEGVGGMGEVYRAFDVRLSRDVALKVLPERLANDAHALARLKREAHVLASLNHPNIAALYGVEEIGDVPALVLEFVDGTTLADRLVAGAMPFEQVRSVAMQIAAALEAAHDRGIIHRDLKPSNIKVRADGTVKLLDFGLAKSLEPPLEGADVSADTVSLASSSATGLVIGTAAYMSPEQARGEAVDTRVDIWAFGCVVYEMLTGGRAFTGATVADLFAAVLTSTPDWNRLPREVPPALAAFLRRSLSADARQRVRDIGDLRLAFEGAFEQTDDAIAAGRASEGGRGRRLRIVLAATVAAAAAVALTVWTLAVRLDERPITFALHPPAGYTYGPLTMDPYPVLSPDSRHLAFIAKSETGRLIWVQEVGSLDPRPVKGTEGADVPFWSPDGRFIAFTAQGRLRRIDVAGEHPAQDICICGVALGGAWSPDGTIVFVTHSGLSRVAAAGGTPTPLTKLDESAGEYTHRWPVLLPDSATHFVYLVRSTRDDRRGVYLGALNDPALKKRLTPDDANAAFGFGPDGRAHLLVVRDHTLLALPFDLVGQRIVGEARVVADRIVPGENGRLAPFAVSGRTLVYRPRSPAQNRLLWVNRRGTAVAMVGEPRVEYNSPRLSADGTRLAVTIRDGQTGRRDAWVLDLTRGVKERLTRDAVGAFSPVWGSDDSVIFSSARAGPWNLYARSASGAGEDMAVYQAPQPSNKYATDVTSDGQFLLFHDWGSTWMVPLSGGAGATRLLPGIQARVSPDRRWIAYTTLGSDNRQVYVTSFPTPTERWRISVVRGEDPQWRSDGRELFYVEQANTLTAVAVRPGNRFTAGPPEPLFRAAFDDVNLSPGNSYAVAADGQRFLINESLAPRESLLLVSMNWAPRQ